MPAPTGNQFWKLRSKHGRDKIFSTPEILWDAACEYFQWVEDNPLYESKLVSYQGVSTIEQVPKMRAMTLDGLLLFLGVSDMTWYRAKDDEDFSGVIREIEKVIRQQKFAGAAADLLNANIIARDLGLKDSQEHDHKSSDGSMSPKDVDSKIVESLVNKLID